MTYVCVITLCSGSVWRQFCIHWLHLSHPAVSRHRSASTGVKCGLCTSDETCSSSRNDGRCHCDAHPAQSIKLTMTETRWTLINTLPLSQMNLHLIPYFTTVFKLPVYYIHRYGQAIFHNNVKHKKKLPTAISPSLLS